MSIPTKNASAGPSLVHSGPRIALGIGILGYGVLLFILIGAVAGGSDNSGYFNEARLFSRGRIHVPMRVLPGVPASQTPFLYVPLGFKPAADGSARLVPTYPPGLPLLLVPASWIAGWSHAGDMLLLIHSLVGLALTFSLGRMCQLPASWALAGSAILAASPLYLYLSLQALSDVPATVWATAAVVAALKSRKNEAWALAAGACISVGFLVRPSNFLVALPVLIAVGRSPRRLAWVGLASLPGIAAWAAVNHSAYGTAFQSGYGAIGNEFHSNLIGTTLRYYARWLPLLLSPVVILALAFPVLLRGSPRTALLLAAWAAAFLGFYCAYRWTHEQWWFLRFLLPAAPALIVAGLAVSHHAYARIGGAAPGLWKRALAVLLLFGCLGVEKSQTSPMHEARTIGHGELKYGRVSKWLNAHVPKDSVLIVSQASGALFYFTDFTLLRYEEMKPAVVREVSDSVASSRTGLYAVLWPYEVEVLGRIPGNWTPVGKIDDVTVWRHDG